MSFIRTVLGDIAPGDLGVCYAHEHIIIDRSFTTDRYPEFLLDSVELAAQELAQFRRDGGRAMVDSMPCDSGRNVLKLAEVSRLSGVHIVAPTGLHLPQYYDAGHWGNFYGEDELAQLFIAEIEDGIDAHDLNGPIVRRTPHRAGIIKVAGGRDKLSGRDRKIFRAAAQAQRATGCPILTHTEAGTAGLEQVEVLREAGANLEHVVLSHTDRVDDVSYHRDLLQSGVRLEYDSAFRWKERNVTRELVRQLLPDFPDQILLGMDAARRSYWKSYGGGPGLSFLLTDFRPQLERDGLDSSLLDKVFISNPAQTYAFEKNHR